MACDQIEYCGNCKHYAKCRALAAEGRLCKCYMHDKDCKKKVSK